MNKIISVAKSQPLFISTMYNDPTHCRGHTLPLWGPCGGVWDSAIRHPIALLLPFLYPTRSQAHSIQDLCLWAVCVHLLMHAATRGLPCLFFFFLFSFPLACFNEGVGRDLRTRAPPMMFAQNPLCSRQWSWSPMPGIPRILKWSKNIRSDQCTMRMRNNAKHMGTERGPQGALLQQGCLNPDCHLSHLYHLKSEAVN